MAAGEVASLTSGVSHILSYGHTRNIVQKCSGRLVSEVDALRDWTVVHKERPQIIPVHYIPPLLSAYFRMWFAPLHGCGRPYLALLTAPWSGLVP